ncbi:MAG: hypothetical protein HZB67_04500 [Candidatus Aenigmarchaeota archaeon]|nr:hypothetical protein [Candidatus Aenigmarchaeota archaeon]
MKLLLVSFMLAILFLGSIHIYYTYKSSPYISEKDFCNVDSDCVPEECCHPTSCVNIQHRPNCEGIMCTAVCQGLIDCGAGKCSCIDNRCQVVSG